MKIIRYILFVAFVLLVFSVNGQNKNTLKVRFIPTPFTLSLGFGYERDINDRSSVQLLLNVLGEGFGADSESSTFYFFVPEYKYYYNEERSKSFFVSIFSEIGAFKVKLSGENESHSLDRLISKDGNIISLGATVGQNFKISKQLFVDFYIGPKVKLTRIYRKEIIMSKHQEKTIDDLSLWVRVGVNLNYRF